MIDIAHDLWNVFDLIAVRPGAADSSSTVFVQITDSTSHAKHRTKILTAFEAKAVLLAGNCILLQSWRKVGNRWQSVDEWITLDMFPRSLPDTVKDFYEQQRKDKLPDLPNGSTMQFADTPF